jgi:hypothetical protein
VPEVVPSDLSAHQAPLADGTEWPMRLKDGVLWIPEDAAEMQLRLCVCAHASLAGHRAVGPTADSLLKFCMWGSLKADVKLFSRSLPTLCECGWWKPKTCWRGAPYSLGFPLHG